MMGSCGHSYETSGTIKGGEFLNQLNDHQFPMKLFKVYVNVK
jgi:hypothetical protein